ncbi:MAG: single-stranded DNA-binding protein [Acholeplasmatales bacterium]|nr:single-stranded DNA-binding protein [Acholeplasmatales bacterium]
MNKVTLTGRITKDPEIRYTSSGAASLQFTIAVDRALRDANGNRQADFISCVAWAQQADFISRYVRKGNMLGIVGRIQTRNYQGQDNQVHYVTEVIVEAVENLTPRDPNQAPNPGYQQPQPNNFQQNNNPYNGYNNPTYGQPQPTYQQPQAPKSFEVDVDDEDLPF